MPRNETELHRAEQELRFPAKVPGVSRVVVLTQSFPTPGQPYRGKSNFDMLQRLNQIIDVQVVCAFPAYPRLLQPSWHYPTDPAFSTEAVPAYYVNYPAFPVLSRGLNGYSCAWRTEALIRALQPDVILNYWIYPVGFAAVRLARKLKVPVVVGSIGSDLHRIPDWVSRKMSSWTVRKADCVITKSGSLRDLAISLGAAPERVRTIHNGCDTSIFNQQSRQEARASLDVAADERLLLFVGRLDRRKGIAELCSAFLQLASSDPKLSLVFAGNGPDEAVIRGYLAQPGGDRIQVIGKVEPGEIARWLAACDVFSLPSYNEGCPNAVLEALSCGRPVVATNAGGIPEIMNEQCGYLVPLGDVPALANGLRQALDREWDEQALANQFRRDFHTMAQEVMEMLEFAAGKPLQKRNQAMGALA